MPSPLHVIIIGGGIGGLCLAQGLKRANMSVAVYERNAVDNWPEGYRIHINPVGSYALYTCLPTVLWEAFVAAAGKPPAGLGFLTEQLKELAVIGEDFMSNKTTNPLEAHYPVNRIALRYLLLAGMHEHIHFGKTFERYEHTADGRVTAFFADGTSVIGDLLVGADGANSRVRTQYLPHARRMETGAAGVGGKLSLNEQTRAWLPSQLLSRMNLIMSLNRYTLFNAAFDHTTIAAVAHNQTREKATNAGLNPELLIDNSQDYMLWGFISPAHAYPSNVRSLDGRTLQSFVEQKIAAWHPVLRRIVAESDPGSVSFNPFKTMLPIAPWESTNVTLLGDAIHNMSPVGGLGGNMALRDARALVRVLAAVDRNELKLLSAIRLYEAEMREYGYAAMRMARETTQRAISPRPVARLAARAWFQACTIMPPLKQMVERSWTRHMRNRSGQVIGR